MEAKPKVFFVLGGPGVGKGTNCAMASARNPHIVHLSAGELLRQARASGSEHGVLIQTCIDEGKIVPAQVTVELIRAAMHEYGWAAKKFLVDGFPRNEDNLNTWGEIMTDADVQGCVFLDASHEVMVARIMGRGEGRSDDNPEVVAKRLATYESQTRVIIHKFEEAGKLRRVDCSGTVEEVANSFLEIVNFDN